MDENLNPDGSEQRPAKSFIWLKIVVAIGIVGFIANYERCSGRDEANLRRNESNAVSVLRSEALAECLNDEDKVGCQDQANSGADLLRDKLKIMSK